jgi:hypothetical protein
VFCTQSSSLKDEKEEYVQDLRRLEESLLFQQNLNKQLQMKEQESQTTITQLNNQLGTFLPFKTNNFQKMQQLGYSLWATLKTNETGKF